MCLGLRLQALQASRNGHSRQRQQERGQESSRERNRSSVRSQCHGGGASTSTRATALALPGDSSKDESTKQSRSPRHHPASAWHAPRSWSLGSHLRVYFPTPSGKGKARRRQEPNSTGHTSSLVTEAVPEQDSDEIRVETDPGNPSHSRHRNSGCCCCCNQGHDHGQRRREAPAKSTMPKVAKLT